jgi:glycosyltransferase involved in cell wall biosynthesis
MKILMVHNEYLSSGGEDISFRMEVDMLRRHDCQVVTMVESNLRVVQLGRVRTAARSIWSPETFRRVRALLRGAQFDVVHVQNFFPLISPSVYYAARSEGVPVIQSLRNYRLVCAAGTLNRDGHVCEDCTGRAWPWPAIWHACYQNNVVGSAVVGAMQAINRGLGTWFHAVDAYIAVSDFMRAKYVACGFPPEKIFVKSNFLYPDPMPGKGDGNFALFVGRLTPEKGLGTLLRAWDLSGQKMPLKVVGTGPMTPLFTNGSKLPSIEHLGWQPTEEVLRLMGSARFIVIPTEWYEGHPRTAVEAFSRGLPVIASQIGGMAEMIEDGRTGVLFRPGDADDLAAKIGWALEHRESMSEIGAHGREVYELRYTDSMNYRQLSDIYHRVLTTQQDLIVQPSE